MIKLGTEVTEKATGLAGMLIHMMIYSNGNRFYNFQPRGLNQETGAPLKRFWVAPDMILGGEVVPDPDNLQLEVLGTQVVDAASGFMGTASAITLHINGCIHVEVQPAGTQLKTNERIVAQEFDIRLLRGSAIKPMSEAALEDSQRTNPSPVETDGPLTMRD